MSALSAGVTKGVSNSGLVPTTSSTVVNAVTRQAISSALTQGIAVQVGLQDHFSWKQVGQAALGGAVTAGIGQMAQAGGMLQGLSGSGAWASAGRAALSSGVNQALHGNWSWREIVASAVGGGAGAAAGNALNGSAIGNAMGSVGRGIAAGFVGGVAGQWAGPGGKANYGSTFASTLGSVLGDEIAGGMASDRNPSNKNYRNEMDRESDNYSPVFNYNYRNGSDVQSDGPARQYGFDAPMQPIDYSLAAAGPVRLNAASAAYGLVADDTPRGSEDWPLADLDAVYGPGRRTADFIPGIDDAQFINAGGSTQWRTTPRTGYRVTQQFELAVNNRANSVYEALGEFAQLGDYQRASNSDFDLINEWTRHNQRGDIINQIRGDIAESGRLPALGTTRLPSLIDSAFMQEVPNYSAEELAKHVEYSRRWALAKQGTLTLGADFSIQTIGKNRLTPDQFAEQLQRVYERSVTTAASLADQDLAAGRLYVPYVHFEDPYVAEQIAKGNFVDRFAKTDVTKWLSTQAVPDSPFGLVSIGRQFPEIGKLANYRMPDLLVRFGPGDIFALDATLGTKTAATPQVRDTLNYGASKWGNVTPSGTQWITNPKLVPLLPRKK